MKNMNGHVAVSTILGTIFTYTQIHSDDIIKTIVLTSIAGITSFIVSMICKWIVSKYNYKTKKDA